MRVIAFVGPSGTGKSYRSITVSENYGADAIIDDGILISHGKVLAGTSAKKEPTKLASVRHALFMNEQQCRDVRSAIVNYNIKCVMILGTSDGMVKKIAANIGIPEVSAVIHIEDVATKEEIAQARASRVEEGQHVIPVPTLEIKQEFSGYFLHPLRYFQKNLDAEGIARSSDKSIVRPTFSYMGDYMISDSVLNAFAIHEARKIPGLINVTNINLRKTVHGVHIDMTVSIVYGEKIHDVCRKIQRIVKRNIEAYTSVNVRRVNILVRTYKKIRRK